MGTELVAYANRLPVSKTRQGWRPSSGGLVSALRPALERAFASGRPTLVNVLTDPEVVYPRKSNLA